MENSIIALGGRIMTKDKDITTECAGKCPVKNKRALEPYDRDMLWRYQNFCDDNTLKTKKTFTRS